MNKYKVEPVHLLPEEQYAKLSQEEKMAYITRALKELTRHAAATAAAKTPGKKPY